MRVAIYAGRTPPEGGGGFTFEESVLDALLTKSGTGHELVVLGGQHAIGRAAEAGVPTREVPEGSLRRGLLKLPRPSLRASLQHKRLVTRSGTESLVAGTGADFLVCLGPEVPTMTLPYLMIIWDLQHRTQPFYPEVSLEGVWERRERYFSRVIPRASRVVVGTEVGREELADFYGFPHSRVTVLPHPTPSFALQAAEAAANGRAPEGFPVGQPYVFYPAQFWAHKNHVSLIEAIRTVRHRGTDCKLVLVGSDRGGNLTYVKEVADKEASDAVLFLDFVDREELVWLYRNAIALVYPSLFGPENLPPLEAFALGCPVIAERVPGADEQMGDAALLGNGSGFFAEAIVKLAGDADARRSLIDRGLERASRSTPASFVDGLLRDLDLFQTVRRTWRGSE